MQDQTTAKLQDFPARLRFFRSQRKISQEALGTLIGKKATTVSTWERGESEPSLGDIALIAAHLGVSASRLAYGEPVETPSVVAEAQAEYRISGKPEASPVAAAERSSPKMLDPRFQPRDEPTAHMCAEHFAEFLKKAEQAPGGIGFTWRMLQKHFPLDEFGSDKKPT